MVDRLRVALAQLNPKVGDIAGNLAKVRAARAEAAKQGADLVLYSELVLAGYFPEDLVLKPAFQKQCMEAVEALRVDTLDGGPAVFVTTPWHEDGKLYNAIIALDKGEIIGKRFKVDLPNYGVFDDKRVFSPGPMPGPLVFRGVRIGVPICEDMWTPDVVECITETGGEILLVPNGSPYEVGKTDLRVQLGIKRVIESGLPLVYLNQVGGQDEVIYDGASFAIGADRQLKCKLPTFREQVTTIEFRRGAEGWECQPGPIAPELDEHESIYQAMMLGLRDYVNKTGFPSVVIGLSGGVDSALTAAVASDALGPERVHTLMMPSPYTSAESLEDAKACAEAIGVRYDIVGIEPAMEAFRKMLLPLFGNAREDVTEENIQSRARGVTLMAVSNKLGGMVVTTGNKSEMAVGYATLYGDMCGGYNVLKDVYKTTVFELCSWRNRHRPEGALGRDGRVIPERILTKPPSAELRPDQKDSDSLPPYPVLDAILRGLIERDLGADELVAEGYDRDTVNRVWRLLETAEYKRRQAPPGVKITSRLISRERRYPIVNGFRG
ncbi:NAD+ synthase [Enhydrobacter aerosaccus]|uniref:Glutamine-dependent NAD(+) synthetase n=1 Tax=Enhydrobacter aerosaccus TaxID=225324 RepID=A0A1T4JV65_9HYPH|nr:NAD+ synthase [Enhydrobacter aerosaccus]SJZ33985.1 NAD+ synthase [Enhydrobacter aerosaccus]